MTQEIRLCIIDDIPDVVNGIAKGIPWSQYGLVVAGTAGNGEEGMRIIREAKPHIVLTDIRMPRMDGLEMMQQLTGELPALKIIFLSGYTDFDYAQQAVQLGAFDFIVKPFTPQKILEVTLKAKAAIDEEMEQRQHYHDMERKLRESLPYLRQEYFQLLLQFPTDPVEAAKRWDFLAIELDREQFTVMLIEIDGFAERTRSIPVQEVELIRFTLHNILVETIGSMAKGLIFRENTNRFVAIINPSASCSMEALAELCRENINKYSKFTISLGIGGEVRYIHEIYYSYTQAQTALSYNFYTGGNSVYSHRDVRPLPEAVPRYSAEKEKELFYCLRSGNKAKAEEVADELFSQTVDEGITPPPEVIKDRYYELAFLINRVFAEKLTPAEMKPLEEHVHRIKEMSSYMLKDLQHTIKELCRMGCRQMVQKQTEEGNRTVEQAIAYIRENLHTNLTVNDCAKLVFLSGSYFANLFKKITGTTVGQFITTERMDRAKQMLVEGKPVQEIYLALGYEGRQYFSELFKKHTGMTPSEFRQTYADKSPKGTH